VLLGVSHGSDGVLTFTGWCAYLQRSWDARDPFVTLRIAHFSCRSSES